jgi:hypothetical protein
VEGEPLVARQPCHYLGMLVGAVVSCAAEDRAYAGRV